MKRNGDYHASDYYLKALHADPSEPCYEVFFGDYLRNFRGASVPLFPEAESHYFEGLKKLRLRHEDLYRQADEQTKSYLDRGLSALYQQDGVSVLERSRDVIQRIADYRSADKNNPDYYARHTVMKALTEIAAGAGARDARDTDINHDPMQRP